MKFRKKPVEVEATQWYKNGDHPDDGETDAVEGKIVRYFRNPSWDGEVECSVCGIRFHEHGWIDTQDWFEEHPKQYMDALREMGKRRQS